MKAILQKLAYLPLFILCWLASGPLPVHAQVVTLPQTVAQALKFSPQLQALAHNNEAITYDLKQARARYRPSVDLLLGYGLGQHSDSVTRLPGADPSDSDWDSRGDATLRLAQKVYDGGETSQSVSIQKARLDSASFGIQDATQAISLNAISAHLDVYRQHELVTLAKKDLEVHQDIYRALSEIAHAGAGNIADVTQTQARMARAESILIVSEGDLSRAMSNYERVVGVKPGELAFAEVPQTMPNSLEEALKGVEANNPGLSAFNARLMEAEARVGLARSAYKPKFNLELSSRYHDQLEGDPSWQHTNDAMLVMRWNLFNGGQDKEATNAAISRKYESRSNRDDKLLELREATTSAWATYLSLQSQKRAYEDAVASSQKTFDAYLKQFSVSRRSLLDVLNAEKEYFQSARQLVSVSVDEIITAYRILSLGGALQIPNPSGGGDYSTALSRLAQAIDLPAIAKSKPPEPDDSAALAMAPAHRVSTGTEAPLSQTKAPGTSGPAAMLDPLRSIEIGPCINRPLLEQAKKVLHRRGVVARQTPGTGMVRVTRLLEGVYPVDAAKLRLKELRKTIEAFALPEDGQLAIYVGSFIESEKAIRYAQRLAENKIAVTPIAVEIKMQGDMLMVQPVDRQTAVTISEQMLQLGLSAKLTPPDPN